MRTAVMVVAISSASMDLRLLGRPCLPIRRLTLPSSVTLSSGNFLNWMPDFKINWDGTKNNYDLVSKPITINPIPGPIVGAGLPAGSYDGLRWASGLGTPPSPENRLSVLRLTLVKVNAACWRPRQHAFAIGE